MPYLKVHVSVKTEGAFINMMMMMVVVVAIIMSDKDEIKLRAIKYKI
jgi:hypothetical protein